MQNINFTRNQYQNTNMRNLANERVANSSNIFSNTSSRRVVAPMERSYTQSFKAQNKVESDTQSDPEDAFERKLWFQKMTTKSLQIKFLTIFLAGLVVYESHIQLRSLSN